MQSTRKIFIIMSLAVLAGAGALLLFTVFKPKKLSPEAGDVVVTKLAGDFERKWAINENGWTITHLTARGETVYFSGQGTYAVDAVSGNKSWESATRCDQSLVAGSELLYCKNYRSGLSALDLSSGKERWQSATGEGGMGTSVSGNSVYTGNSQGTVIALDAITGKESWRATLASGTSISILDVKASGDVVAVILARSASNERSLVALDAATGTRKWERQVSPDSPLAAEGGLIFTTQQPAGATGATITKLLALDANNGDIAWEQRMEGTVSTTIGIVAGTLYVGRWQDSQAILTGLDPATGSEKWSCRFDAANTTPMDSPVAFDVSGGLVFFSTRSEIDAADAQTGDLKWRLKPGGILAVQPVIANGSVCFVYGSAGTLYAIARPEF